MSRLRDFRLDLARYFGFGEGSDRAGELAQEKEAKEEKIWTALVRIGPPLTVAFTLRGVLGFDDDFRGFLATMGMMIVAFVLWGIVLKRAGMGGRGEPDVTPPDG